MFKDPFQVMTFLIMVVNICGTVLNSHQKVSGFFVWGVCNVAWAIVNFQKGIGWQGVQNIIFLVLNVYGILCWKYGAGNVWKQVKSALCFSDCKCCKK
ncbi:MAG: nicotinamide mononucleotide transporter family protein [Holosporales bacterium]|nr:nicotinamide mononucleotide transporter family protein [Holosporales bacterium]